MKQLSGQINIPYKSVTYKGLETATANTVVDNAEKIISVDVNTDVLATKEFTVDEVNKEQEFREAADTLLSEKITTETQIMSERIEATESAILENRQNLADEIDARQITEEKINELIETKQAKLTAGENITITENEETGETIISSTGGGEYTAGEGLILTESEFSIDEQIVAKKSEVDAELLKKQDLLTAGENITIEPDSETGELIISATGGGSEDIIAGSGNKSLLQKIDVESWTFNNDRSDRNGETISTDASGDSSFSMGGKSKAEGKRAVAEGTQTIAQGNYSHVEGNNSISVGNNSHAEGIQTVAKGSSSHTEGSRTVTLASAAHAEGNGTTAEAEASHAEGAATLASGISAHAEGDSTTASGLQSHAEGNHTVASGDYSHAEGAQTAAQAIYSHASGFGTIASKNSGEFVCGKYNLDLNDSLFEVGNGTSDNRSNAFSVSNNGDIHLGNLYSIINGYFNGTASYANSAANASNAITANSATFASSAGSATSAHTAAEADFATKSSYTTKVQVAGDSSISLFLCGVASRAGNETVITASNVWMQNNKIYTSSTIDSDRSDTLITKDYMQAYVAGHGKVYDQGYGISINGNTISVDSNVMASKDDTNDLNTYITNVNHQLSNDINSLSSTVDTLQNNINDKLNKMNSYNAEVVYGINNNNETTLYTVSAAGFSNSIIKRDDAGRARIGYPDALDDIANKVYVDNTVGTAISTEVADRQNAINALNTDIINLSNSISNKLDKDETATGYVRAYVVDNNGYNTTIQATPYIESNTFIYRDDFGRARVNYPQEDDHIANKVYVDNAVGSISIPSALSQLTNDTGFITDSALIGLATELFVNNKVYGLQVQLDKCVTSDEVTTELAKKEDVIEDLETIRANAALGATAVQPETLATVATSGNYEDLINKPDIPSVEGLATETYVDNKVATAIDSVLKTVTLTQAEFDALEEYADNTNYQIID